MPHPESVLVELDTRELLSVLTSVKKGDFTARLPGEYTGISGKIADALNEVIDQNARLANELIGDLVRPTTEMARVIGAVAKGDLTQTMAPEIEGRPLKGEFLRTARVVNTMVNQLGSFASEVTRVAREVGTEGKLGGQAVVKGVGGTWQDLTDNVNSMAANLTKQVRGIAKVVTAVANGDLKRELVLDAKGEIAELAETINGMSNTLAVFADQVTSVAREVGIEGKLGGQALVPGAAGIWRDLTGNVNQLAANLTTQVRAIAEVATAVTKGDLTRSIIVDTQGELAALKDNINEMIRNLKDTTSKNTEQDWLKTNLARFSRMLQGQRDLLTVARQILSELAPLVGAHVGAFYLAESEGSKEVLRLLAGYATDDTEAGPSYFQAGQGIVGQCALEKRKILLSDLPGDYLRVRSGLGSASPVNVIVLPVLFETQIKAVVELGSFHGFSDVSVAFLDQLTESIGIVLNTIEANMQTETLLQQSQALAEELKQTNEELKEKARLLSEQKGEVELKNREIEQARRSLEEKAGQLALTSKYKSQFLANMSHELRTPLNSLLILSKMLAENAEANLTSKQVQFAQTIHSSGSELMELINDILDLSKIESGTVTLSVGEHSFEDLRGYAERTFRQMAQAKNLDFAIQVDAELPSIIQTDGKMLQQVLKNLLSNSFKFTERGRVELRMGFASAGWSADHPVLSRAASVVAFAVADSGIGISEEKHRIIFEAFQQADGTTSRKYGGTGLGLSISREIAQLLGGEIRLESRPGEGSTFTLYLPLTYTPVRRPGEDTKSRVTPPVELATQLVQASEDEQEAPASRVEDDRDKVRPGDAVLLIVEDDPTFAEILLSLARETGFKGIVALGARQALALAGSFFPSAITLDVGLPDTDGWSILDRFKHDSATRHIPVCVISGGEDWRRAVNLGAAGFLRKPASREDLTGILIRLKDLSERRVKDLLVVEDDETQRESIRALLESGDVRIASVGSAREALDLLRARPFDAVILDLLLPDMGGIELIRTVQSEPGAVPVPFIVYTGKELSGEEEAELERVAEAVVLKSVKSPERLLDETTLLLHRSESDLGPAQRRILQEYHQVDRVLCGRKFLIVDDDLRNIFALTSVLERYGMEGLYAESGEDALALLEKAPDVDVVLMDIMMPEMDGYETIRAIRQKESFRSLPIIALTAKAMKGDREKCIESGASDYVSKPVDIEQLRSLLRVQLSR